jgi:hypothetical protein
MDRHYYVEKEHETSETSDRFEAARIAAEWIERGYKVETVVVDATDESVQLADSTDVMPPGIRAARCSLQANKPAGCASQLRA